MILGEFLPSVFFKTFSVVLVITITLIYLIAQYEGHEKPIAWISSCAHHFPQYIFFRISTISGSVFIILGWFTNHFYLRTVCAENNLNLQKYRPYICLILGTMGGLLLMGSTANIDTGDMNQHWHTACASSFFVMTFFAILYNTVLSWIIQEKTHALDQRNLTYKSVFAVVLIVLTYLTTKSNNLEDDVESNLGIIIEWLGTYNLAIYFYLMSRDLSSFVFVYQLKEKDQTQMIY